MNAEHVIIGAGCAGLSLACALVEAGARDIVVVEPRTTFPRDRTWCYWQVHAHPFEAAVSHRWDRWRLQAGGRVVEGGTPRYPYCHLPADAFYALALQRLKASGVVTLRLGERVESLAPSRSGVEVRTSGGVLNGRRVFDSRPPSDAAARGVPGEITLLQHFVGLEVEVAEPVFEPGVVTLMDFDLPSSVRGVHFIYVLPFSPHRALVEDTYFSEGPLPPEVYDENIRAYLRERLGVSSFTVERREAGIIPMTTTPLAGMDGPNLYRIGIRGGLAKPSTGYAFLGIQRHSQALARRIARGGSRLPPPRGHLDQAMDRVFLAVLHRWPELAPEIFLTLFDALPSETLVRFLSDQGGLRDRLRVVLSLPSEPFVAAARATLPLWLGRPR